MAKDLVCGMTVDEKEAEKAGLTSQQQGTTYYFCSPGCKERFDADPRTYVMRRLEDKAPRGAPDEK